MEEPKNNKQRWPKWRRQWMEKPNETTTTNRDEQTEEENDQKNLTKWQMLTTNRDKWPEDNDQKSAQVHFDRKGDKYFIYENLYTWTSTILLYI